MAEESSGEKTLPASPQKKQKAREEGNVPKSQDLSAAWALFVALLAMYFMGGGMFTGLIEMGRYWFGHTAEMTGGQMPLQGLVMIGLSQMGSAIGMFMLVMMLAGLTANLAQVGFILTGKPITPNLNRINPISGLQRFVSVRSLVELAKSLSKLGLVGYIVWLSLRGRVGEMVGLAELEPATLVPLVAWFVVDIWWRVILAMVIIGLTDYLYQRWQHERDLRMTVQEAKEEAKQLEGDPRIKQRVRQLQRQIAQQRMMAEVPTADVVITNPTTYAVALRYEMGEMDAPTVVAKGARLVAQRIRELAMEHDVPIVERPELARALFRTIEIGESIPENLFRAVAEVLSYVYQIDRRQEKRQARAAAAKTSARTAGAA